MAWDAKRTGVRGEIGLINDNGADADIRIGGSEAKLSISATGTGVPRFDNNSVFGEVHVTAAPSGVEARGFVGQVSPVAGNNESAPSRDVFRFWAEGSEPKDIDRITRIILTVAKREADITDESVNGITSRPAPETTKHWDKIDAARMRRLKETRDMLVHMQGNGDRETEKTLAILLGDKHQLAPSEIVLPLDNRGVSLTFDIDTGDYVERDYEHERHTAARYASQKASSFLDDFAILLPERINKEVLGDFLEDINRRAAQGQQPWKIYVRAAFAAACCIANSVGYFLKALGIRKSA